MAGRRIIDIANSRKDKGTSGNFKAPGEADLIGRINQQNNNSACALRLLVHSIPGASSLPGETFKYDVLYKTQIH